MPCASSLKNSHAVRRGISLIEILISIGVVAIGLLGVMALIPLAHHQAIQGMTNDRAALVARRAFREFRIRGMDRPRTWFEPSIGDVSHRITKRVHRQAWVIDPLGYAAYDGQPGQRIFPADPALDSTSGLRRVTLRAGVVGPARQLAMSSVQANEVFVSVDDLAFDIPNQDGMGPLQKLWTFDGTNTAVLNLPSDNSIKRYADGRFSWFATLVPELNSDSYTLSVVVLHRRVLDPARERFAPVRSFSAGELQLVVPNQKAVHEILKKDGWILITQRLRPAVDASTELVVRWYRIVHSDARASEAASFPGNTVVRSLTVSGPDWPISTPASVGGPAVAVLIPDIVAVYDKTIHLESSRLWPDVTKVPGL